jgi:lysophospholipase L1-like esterase
MTVLMTLWCCAAVCTTATAQAQTVAPTTAPTAARPAPQPRQAEDAVTPRVKDPRRHEQFLYRIKQGEIGLLFMGDSITDGWPRGGEFSWLKFAPYKPANFGIGGDKTEHVLWRITNGELDGINPKVVVLMIGTNNIGGRPADEPEWAAAGVTKIVQTIHEKLPQTKVLLLGVFPRATKTSPQRDAVGKINQIISKLDDGSKTRYLDIGKVFLDADGELPADIMPDKLHLTSKGYDLWYDAMHPLLEEMMKQ